MRRKSLVVARVLVLLALALAACAPGATPTPTATVPPPTPTPPPATPTPAFQPMKVEAPDCNYGGEFKAIEAVDQYTVRFTLCYPDPAFPSKVAFAAFAIQDKDYLDANGGDTVKMSEKPNGTGPYKVKEWIRGDRIIFEANPDYWGEKPKAKTLVFRWSKEAAARLLELQAGTVDGIDNPNPEDFEVIQKDPNLQLYIRPPLNIAYLGLNNNYPPLDNEKVRQAIAMAIDRERLVKNFYPAGSMVAEQFVPPALKPGYTEGLKWYDYNPQEAKRLLAEAGYPNGFDITLSYRDVVRGYLPRPGQVAQDIQAQLAEVGIRVKIKVMESGAFLDSVAAGNEPMYLLGWLADYPDATNFYDYHFANEANLQFGKLFPDLVEEIRAAARLSDPAARQKHYDKVNELIKQHVPMVPLAHGVAAAAFKATVKGAHASPLNNERFSVMDPGKDELVWMQNAEPIALWCADETDGETFRACIQVYEPLLDYKVGGVEVVPALAERYEANADLTVWTFYLRKGVKFHNGAELDANDVVATFKAQWDAKDPNHKGRTGTFEYFSAFFGSFLNAEK
jgi:ABC-type dipeptide transport system, periplasmic component